MWLQRLCHTVELMCLQIAKYQFLCYKLIIFNAAHLSQLLSDSPLLIDVVWHYHRYGPKDGGMLCDLLGASSLLFCAHYHYYFFCFLVVVRVSRKVRGIIWFFFSTHVMRQYEFTVPGYNELLLHLSVSSTLVNHGDKVFHYPPTASHSCLFKPCRGLTAGCRRIPAQRALLSMDTIIKHCWLGFFTIEKKLDQGMSKREPEAHKWELISECKGATVFPVCFIDYI